MPRGKVLLADDEAHVRLVLARRFEAMGYDVRMASDGEQALALARQDAPDVVVTDVQMPHMSGVELSLALREVESCKNIPIVMLSARSYIVQEGELATARVTHVLTKPFSIRKVVGLVVGLLPAGLGPLTPDEGAADEGERVRGLAA